MRPLQAIGMGLVIVVLSAPLADPGLDAFPDPLGWLLAAYGVWLLPATVARRGLLLGLAVACVLVSVLLWVPATAQEVHDADESLLWALDLPRMAFLAVLALSLARAAGDGGDHHARAWWRLVLVGSLAGVALPPIVFGPGVGALAVPAAAVATATLVGCLVLCFAHSARPWVQPVPPAGRSRAAPPGGGAALS